MAANLAIKAAAAPHVAAKHRPGAAPGPNVKPAVQHYTGLLAAPLNELGAQEQRVRDVAARRQADAQQYHDFVLGQQGKLAAASAAADHNALRDNAAIQLMAAGANAGSLKGLQDARAAQGISGAVPSQQVAPVVDDQLRSNLMLAAGSRSQADLANTNQGKAGFLAAAAQAGHQAAVARIAGDEFDQTSAIRRDRTGLLTQREQMAADIKAAEEQARADVEKANIAAAARDADRASRERIAGDNLDARQQEGETNRAFRARQARLDRRVRLQTSANHLRGSGYADPKERQRRVRDVSDLQGQRDAAVSAAKTIVKSGGLTDPNDVRAYIMKQVKGAPREVVDYALASALGHKAGVTPKGGKSAARRYYDLERAKRRGRA